MRGLGEIFGELPVATLSDEIETPGEGQVRALITIAGNPVVSTPNAGRLDAALASLDFMVSVDIYVNETTRHADVILPVPVAAREVAVRHRLLLLLDPQHRELLAGADGSARGDAARVGDAAGADCDRHRPGAGRRPRGARRVRRGGGRPASTASEPDPQLRGPERLLDMMLRAGPYDADARGPAGRAARDRPRRRSSRGCRRCCGRRAGRSSSRPSRSLPTSRGCATALGERRQRRHGAGRPPRPALEQLVDAQPAAARQRARSGARRWLHPDDAARLGLSEGELVRVSSRAGAVELPFEMTEDVMPGVVSIPHGWGHDVRRRAAARRGRPRRRELQRAGRRDAPRPGVGQRRAQRHPGRSGGGAPT